MDKFAVIGLGYVGLRSALSLSKHGQFVIGFDVNKERLAELAAGVDRNLDISKEQLKDHHIQLTDNKEKLKEANFYIVDIGTPVNNFYIPDMSTLKSVCRDLGSVLKKGDMVVFESTVYPGATEEVFLPLLEQYSGLKNGEDFLVGYSPERIVPGDVNHDINNTEKILAGQNKAALDRMMQAYRHMVDATLVPVSTVKTSEAVKILENIQRDVNIALMNEFAIVMDKMGVNMNEVLEAAATKWNFLPFKPGLVGGHCISVDPYYLIYKARGLHIDTDLISTARKVNENFVNFIIETVTNKIIANYMQCKNLKIAILGLSYKKNVTDVRNSLSFTLYEKLTKIGFDVVSYDPVAWVKEAHTPITQTTWEEMSQQQAIIITVDHDEFRNLGLTKITNKLYENGMLFDIPGMFYKCTLPRKDISYWSV
jgi:UDP-N-acetyl-D-galactosamine dehydrogenase